MRVLKDVISGRSFPHIVQCVETTAQTFDLSVKVKTTAPKRATAVASTTASVLDAASPACKNLTLSCYGRHLAVVSVLD
jgi:hypothetical protein